MTKPILAVRKEDKNRWERRVPLTPENVKTLVSQGVQVWVEKAPHRVFADAEYSAAGALLKDDISEADFILGVKEIPVEHLHPNKTYVFFSHVVKAQAYNMARLDHILAKNIRLLDYERITDEEDVRLVKFGRFAGIVGMNDILPALADRLLTRGMATPFLHIAAAFRSPNYAGLQEAVKKVGAEIATLGLPEELGPMVFAFTSQGSVAQGATEVFKLLPHEFVTVEQLKDLVSNPPAGFNKKVYGVVCRSSDLYVHKDHVDLPKSKVPAFDTAAYYADPTEFVPVYDRDIAEYVSVLVHCAYWNPKAAPFHTYADYKARVEAGTSRLLGISDISCDVAGANELLKDSTTLDAPHYFYDIKKDTKFAAGSMEDGVADGSVHHNPSAEGIVILAVENMPTELPWDASQHFGHHLTPMIPQLLSSPTDSTLEECEKNLPGPLFRSMITLKGELTPRFKYISEMRAGNDNTGDEKDTVLLLGSGMVTAPCVEHILSHTKANIHIASFVLPEAETLVARYSTEYPGRLTCSFLNVVEDAEGLSAAVSKASVVISLVPAPFHPKVARACIDHKVHLATASYVSPGMKELHEEAVEAGVVLFNEAGLDPGIDHISAVAVIRDVQEKGGKVTGFTSWCGGLPAAADSGNALGYKFSWSPRGVLTALRNNSVFVQGGKERFLAGEKLLPSASPVPILPGYNTEGYPNRDSRPYIDLYNLVPEEVKTMFRGTLRFRPFSSIASAFTTVGFLSTEDHPLCAKTTADSPAKWVELTASLVGAPAGSSQKAVEEAVSVAVGGGDAAAVVVRGFRELGLFSTSETITPSGTPLDTLCALLSANLVYKDGEHDLVLLHHVFDVEAEDGSSRTVTSTLCVEGDDHHTAMARTVGVPVALVAEMCLAGELDSLAGVRIPVNPEVCSTLLERLAEAGIVCKEETVAGNASVDALEFITTKTTPSL